MKLPSGLTPVEYTGTQYSNWTPNEEAMTEFENWCAGAFGFKNTNGQGRDRRDFVAPYLTDEMLERRRLRDLYRLTGSANTLENPSGSNYRSSDLS
jgi:hypothetical protein